MANSSSLVSLKLLINTQTQKVLFAEAGKDFVDFLFGVLSLPVAKVIGLVGKQGVVGSLANLFESVENLNETYVQSSNTKKTLLKPPSVVSSLSKGVPLLANINAAPAQRNLYSCDYCCRSYSSSNYVSDDPRAICPKCTQTMTNQMSFVESPAEPGQQFSVEGGGFVKGVVTYMVMDDLVVKPMSTISSITMLNKFNINNVGALEEKVVDFGMDEAVKLLKASMETKNVLTTVFLKPTN